MNSKAINTFTLADQQNSRVVIATTGKLLFYPLQQILYLKGQGNYTLVYLLEGKQVLTLQCLGHYQHALEDLGCFRLGASYIINPAHITAITKRPAPRIILSTGTAIPIPIRQIKPVQQRFFSSN